MLRILSEEKKRGRVKQREEGMSANTLVCIIILWEKSLQLNGYISCICLDRDLYF